VVVSAVLQIPRALAWASHDREVLHLIKTGLVGQKEVLALEKVLGAESGNQNKAGKDLSLV
jgi:hypothetical protein